MLQAALSNENGVTRVRLSGILDETVDLDKSIGTPQSELHVYCGGIKRINSQGVKAWAVYFQRFNQGKAKLEFHECSPVIVQGFNDFFRFDCGGRVVSIQIPYLCQDCGKDFTQLATCDSIRLPGFNAESCKCPGCGKECAIDEDPKTYFHFLKKAK